jgi:hypothetical protein
MLRPPCADLPADPALPERLWVCRRPPAQGSSSNYGSDSSSKAAAAVRVAAAVMAAMNCVVCVAGNGLNARLKLNLKLLQR